MIDTHLRRGSLGDLRAMLVDQHGRKIDVVSSAQDFTFADGELIVSGIEPQIEESGVTDPNGVYRLMPVFVEGLSAKLGIPLAYLRKLHDIRTDLFDANVNGWLDGVDGGDPDPRSFLLRLFRGDGERGLGRAFLSNSYRVVDNLDVLTAAIDGVNKAGVDVEIAGCDLSERAMRVRIVCPQVKAIVKDLFPGYRSPYGGLGIDDLPFIFAGFELTNSELGDGAFSITPRAVLQVCKNGQTRKIDAMREVHLGARLDDGVIRWSEETQKAALQLVTTKATDAVRTFLSPAYLDTMVAALAEKSGKPVPNVTTAVQLVGKQLRFDEETTNGVFEAFMRSGTPTAGGVMQAVTAYAATIDDPDKAATVEGQGFAALDAAAALT